MAEVSFWSGILSFLVRVILGLHGSGLERERCTKQQTSQDLSAGIVLSRFMGQVVQGQIESASL